MRSTLKIAVFYPWNNILERKSGSSRRTGDMMDVLKDEFSEIVCTSPFDQPDVRMGNTYYRGYRWPFSDQRLSPLVRSIFNGILGFITLGKSKGEEGWLWLHCIYAVDPVFAAHVDRITDWADTVIVEFTFSASAVVNACRRKGKKVIISLHDILSDHITKSRLLKRLTQNAEINAMKNADCIVCSSFADRDKLRKYGLRAEVIPHGVDMRRYRVPRDLNDPMVMRTGSGEFHLPRRNICLFVGAWHVPNFEAVNIIRDLAKSMQSVDGDTVNFIVVGDCCKPERRENFIALGKVDEDELHLLYGAADIILIPLRTGAGASIKTIEAMAYGKAILGSTVAFRGYPVESGTNCLISDDFPGYKKIIIELLSEKDKRIKMGANARKFAEIFDSRRLYGRYVELITGEGLGGR